MKAEGEVRSHRELQALGMKERAVPSGRLRSFGSVTSQRTVAKFLSEGRDTVSCERILLRVATLMGGGTTFLWLPAGGADRE